MRRARRGGGAAIRSIPSSDHQVYRKDNAVAFLDKTAFTIGNVGVTWAYLIAAVLASSVLIRWAYLDLLGHGDNCPGCKRTFETCSCVDIKLAPLPFLVYDPATMNVLSEHDTQEAAQEQADLLGAEVLVLDE